MSARRAFSGLTTAGIGGVVGKGTSVSTVCRSRSKDFQDEGDSFQQTTEEKTDEHRRTTEAILEALEPKADERVICMMVNVERIFEVDITKSSFKTVRYQLMMPVHENSSCTNANYVWHCGRL